MLHPGPNAHGAPADAHTEHVLVRCFLGRCSSAGVAGFELRSRFLSFEDKRLSIVEEVAGIREQIRPPKTISLLSFVTCNLASDARTL